MPDIYQAYLEDLGRIGSHHENARTFYISVITTLFLLVSYSGKDGALVSVQGSVLKIVAVAGIAICFAWFVHMESFRRVFGAKLGTLRELEEELEKNRALKPFTIETRILQEKVQHKAWSYLPLAVVDKLAPVVFVALFVGLILLKN